MNSREFFDKVVKMREAQKDYSKTNDIVMLELSKRLEGEIDSEIERVNKLIGK